MILAAAGVLVGLHSREPSVAGIATQVFAAVGGVAAVRAMWPRVAGTVSPRLFRDLYIQEEPDRARLVALDTRIVIHQDDERQLSKKAIWFKGAACLLALAVLASLTGGIVDVIW